MGQHEGNDGALQLALEWDGQGIAAARVASPRPLAARLLQGRPAAEAGELAPRLFTLCAAAQGSAARRALAAAAGTPMAEPDGAERQRLSREMIGEHLWRLGLDWPPLLGLPPRKEALVAWRKGLPAADRPQWRSFAARALELPRCAAPGTDLLEHLDASAWWQSLPGERDWDCLAAHALAPTLAGRPRETGAAARCRRQPEVAALWQAGRRAAARLQARCLELEALLDGHWDPAWVDACSPAPGIGLARVETARGPLLHLVALAAGTVQRYVIVAPTEWNFHPAGAFVQDTTGLPAPTPEAARHMARCIALSLDPCVAVGITLDTHHHA